MVASGEDGRTLLQRTVQWSLVIVAWTRRLTSPPPTFSRDAFCTAPQFIGLFFLFAIHFPVLLACVGLFFSQQLLPRLMRGLLWSAVPTK